MNTYVIFYHDNRTDLDNQITIQHFEMALRVINHIIDNSDSFFLVSVVVK